ncbi:hypothetical protein EDB86DRAFT_3107085 [Lactarius hatsudake]|nr:hypothetical protein EDB86DRAFT_3107085 [Lactarius hatsudake]
MTTPPSPMKKQPKRARVASGPGLPPPPSARPNSPTLSIASIENAPMVADAEDGPDNSRAILNLVRIVGSPPDTWVTQADVLKMAQLLPTLTTWGGKVDPLDVVVAQAVAAHPDDELAISTLIQRSFEGASIPQRYSFGNGGAEIWFRKDSKRKGTLIGSTTMVHRSVSSRSFAWIVPLVAAWPPPLSYGPEPQASATWCFKVDLDLGLEAEHLTFIATKLGVNYNGYLFRALNKAGEPLIGAWILRLAKKTETNSSISDVKYVTHWLKERTKGVVVEGSVWYEERCCVCWRTDLHGDVKDHCGGACPAIATFNKVRKAVNLTPITIAQNAINASLQKEPVKVEKVAKDFDKMHKELKGEIAALVKRVAALEKKAGIKRGAEPGEPSTPPKKKQKKAKSKESTDGKKEEKPKSPKPEKPVASGSGKGKEKAT